MPAVETEDLSLHYEETGSPDGDPVLLLHGWPESFRGCNERPQKPVMSRLLKPVFQAIV